MHGLRQYLLYSKVFEDYFFITSLRQWGFNRRIRQKNTRTGFNDNRFNVKTALFVYYILIIEYDTYKLMYIIYYAPIPRDPMYILYLIIRQSATRVYLHGASVVCLLYFTLLAHLHIIRLYE